MSKTFRKLSTGNYFGYYKGNYVFIKKRPHGGWCCFIGSNGEWWASEGYHTTYLNTISKATKWFKERINSYEQDC